jgi:hypothetical protein
MTRNTEIVEDLTEMVNKANSCSECDPEINSNAKAEMCRNCGVVRPAISKNASPPNIMMKDPIADGLLRVCAIINGTWNDILASIQSISFLREMALYIDCNILAIWRQKGKRK